MKLETFDFNSAAVPSSGSPGCPGGCDAGKDGGQFVKKEAGVQAAAEAAEGVATHAVHGLFAPGTIDCRFYVPCRKFAPERTAILKKLMRHGLLFKLVHQLSVLAAKLGYASLAFFELLLQLLHLVPEKVQALSQNGIGAELRNEASNGGEQGHARSEAENGQGATLK